MRLAPFGALALMACASVSRPPGGPEDHAPPEIVAVSVDTNATNVHAAKISIQFDEVIAEHPVIAIGGAQGTPTLDGAIIVSPQTGVTGVSWHRDRIDIEPRGGFRANTAYRITLLPGISDIRGNVRHDEVSFVFTTGATLPPFSILGRVFDWQSGAPAPAAVVEAVANAGTPDSLIYTSIADSAGQFDVGPLVPGRYLLRGFIDPDNNRTIGAIEKWDTVTVNVTDSRPVAELLAIQRDTAPPGIQQIDVIDSAYMRVTFDKPFDPKQSLGTNLITLKRADSSVVTVAEVMTETQATAARNPPKSDSVPRPVAVTPVSVRPPAPKPSVPSPERAFVLHLAPGSALSPGGHYSIVIQGVRNLLGHSGTARFEFTAPTPAPKPPAIKPPFPFDRDRYR